MLHKIVQVLKNSSELGSKIGTPTLATSHQFTMAERTPLVLFTPHPQALIVAMPLMNNNAAVSLAQRLLKTFCLQIFSY
jgi:hypothetical protein